MSTPHNGAKPGDFAKTVLMPGDPLRAAFIAETFLDSPRLVNNVRGIQGWTGTYQWPPVWECRLWVFIVMNYTKSTK